MSTAIQIVGRVDLAEEIAIEARGTREVASVGKSTFSGSPEVFETVTVVSDAPAGQSRVRSKQRSHRRTLRRLRGFVIEFQGLETHVAFVDGESVTEYQLPTKYLRENGITERAQPFEMDEYEERSNGKLSTGVEFRPIAHAQAVEPKVVDLSPEEARLRSAIFRKSGRAASD